MDIKERAQGALVGLKKIPQRFIDGLNEKDEILDLAKKLSDIIER